jgi:hypothetical protein
MQYRTLTPIRHDGFDIAAGEVVDLDKSSADGLLAENAIEPVHKPFSGKLSALVKEPSNG